MSQHFEFSEALEAAEKLEPEAQAELVAVLSRRLAERGRERLAKVVADAREEYKSGLCVPMTAKEIVREALE